MCIRDRLSIALSMVVVHCIVMLVQGYDFDSYKKVLLASDFQLDVYKRQPVGFVMS